MTSEIENVRALVAPLADVMKMPIDEIRKQMDQLANYFALPAGTFVEEVDIDGVASERVMAPAVRNDVAILYLHAGDYVMGSPASHRHLIAAISEATQAPAVSLGYRLAPEHPFPAALDDAVIGYRWLLKQGIAPERIAVAGDSAGGGLTIATLVALRDSNDPLPAMGICISPWVDLSCSGESYVTNADTDPAVRLQDNLRFASMYLGDRDPKTPLASPLFADLSGLPPLIIHVSNEEVLLDDSIKLDQHAKEQGVSSTLEVWESMTHVWHFWWPMLKEGRDAIDRIGEYFKTHIHI